MSFLTPFYFLGLAAIAAPIIFHLIRRSPKGEVPFSSLMFLAPTPPRLTRRSRLDYWLLLLLRAAALSLLAFAFARPFLRQAAHLDFGDARERRVAVLIDKSASMRRGDLWSRARALALETIDACRPNDQLAVYAFDTTCRPLLSFHESLTLEPGRRQTVAKALVDQLAPTWAGTNLGQAIVDTLASIEDVADTSEKTARMSRNLVLISDLAQGSRFDALGSIEWPSDVVLEVKSVTDTEPNAGLERLADSLDAKPGESDTFHRIRVFNNPGSDREKFDVTWADEKGLAIGKPVGVYVPPGESRVVRIPKPPLTLPSDTLRLLGDARGFDDTLYFANELDRQINVVYVGNDHDDDPQGLLYYLERVFVDNPRHKIHITASEPSKPLIWDPRKPPELVVVAAETPTNASALITYMKQGGTVLYVSTAPGPAQTLAALAEVTPWNIEAAKVGRGDVMLGEIAFDHPLFASLASAQFNDFTKIRFWNYRRIDAGRIANSRVVARFENGDPAIVEKIMGNGRLIVLASGWQPADSQLARSSKFVPLMAAFLEPRNPRPVLAADQKVGDRVPLPSTDSASKTITVRKPDGTSVAMEGPSTFFDQTDEPGIYTMDTPDGAVSFAVNLDPLESKTTPVPVETIEQFGVRLAKHSEKTIDREQVRQLHNAELEGQQRIWRWLILAVVGTLILETWLAGRARDRTRTLTAEALTA
jgi:hypothetical protein